MPEINNAPSFAALLSSVVTEPGRLLEAYTRFHNYSLGNQLLAWAQCIERGLELGPMATYAAWQTMGRQVRKGSKALVLCQPVTLRRESVDADTGETEKVAFTRFTYRAKWFVLTQTDGQPYEAPALPEWNQALALEALNITAIPFTAIDGNCQGFAAGRSVAVSPIAQLPFKTLIHEVAHVVLGHTAEGELTDTDATPRNLREVEAESVALLVLGTLQQPGLEYCRGYVQHWLAGQDMPERNAQRIFKAADTILRAGRVTVTIVSDAIAA